MVSLTFSAVMSMCVEFYVELFADFFVDFLATFFGGDFLSYFFVKKYLLVGASGMLWTGQ